MKEAASGERYFDERVRLIGSKCDSCGKVFFPKRNVCRSCGSNKLSDFGLSGKGEVYSYTKIRVPPDDFKEFGSYTAAIIKLDEGLLINGIITEGSKPVKIGDKVEMALRRMKVDKETGLITYQNKFRIID